MSILSWLFGQRGGVVKTGGTLGGGKARLIELPVKAPEDQSTAADVLDYACKKHGAKYEITRHSGEVIVDIKLADGHTVVSGRGPTTRAAVTEAVRKLGSQ